MPTQDTKDTKDKWERWHKLSPYAKDQIDRFETQAGRTLHAGSTAEQINAAIDRYKRTAW